MLLWSVGKTSLSHQDELFMLAIIDKVTFYILYLKETTALYIFMYPLVHVHKLTSVHGKLRAWYIGYSVTHIP